MQLRTGKIVPLPLGAQFEIICRQNTIEAALYYFARIERAWMEGSGDNAFRRSTVLMSLIGAPGCGERLHGPVPPVAPLRSHAHMPATSFLVAMWPQASTCLRTTLSLSPTPRLQALFCL